MHPAVNGRRERHSPVFTMLTGINRRGSSIPATACRERPAPERRSAEKAAAGLDVPGGPLFGASLHTILGSPYWPYAQT